ncbi:MAG TPA: AmmeMemoRadiSam system protein B [Nitrospirota bacterium]|nr:AmmeMemoRadiSam system protein B [Nitrospirota bacterium]
MNRQPAVAGHFYRGTKEALRRQVEEFIVSAEKVGALGILSPHAGLIYSGAVAGAVYSSLDLPDTFVLIGPNHTGLGAPVSIMCEGRWETPLGAVDIDEPLARSILSKSPRIQEDSLAHLREHSLEVQLPFIQYFKKSFKIVPIQMLDTRLETCLEVGRAVGEAIKSRGKGEGGRAMKEDQKKNRSVEDSSEPRTPHDVLIIASSDMSHYESAASAKEKDFKAIHTILALDPEGLYFIVKKHGITMCGYGPAVAMLSACKILGASEAKLVKYANSGDVSGDYEQVVGYAGIIVV